MFVCARLLAPNHAMRPQAQLTFCAMPVASFQSQDSPVELAQLDQADISAVNQALSAINWNGNAQALSQVSGGEMAADTAPAQPPSLTVTASGPAQAPGLPVPMMGGMEVVPTVQEEVNRLENLVGST